MSKINEKKDETMLDREEKEFAELLYDALKSHGLGIPTTIEEVENAIAEDSDIDFSDLPTWMQDPAEVLRRRKAFTIKFRELIREEEQCEKPHVARAARFGNEISEEIEERMRTDRMKSRSNAKK